MKTIYLSIFLTLIFFNGNLITYSQEANFRKNNPDQPILFTPKNHDPNFLKSATFPDQSFYQRKSEWKHIIDTTWGSGAPLSDKLKIFNTYAKAIHDKFDGIQSLKLNWDSLYNHYLIQVTDSTSKGAFSSIMSHFAYDLKDLHTFACDTTVINIPLNPGVPVLLIGSYISVEHFGAVTTVLPDSTTLVLRVAPNHPLELEPGDIILGYEGVPWKVLIRELMASGMPFLASTGGCKTVDTYQNLSGAGLNWHLFSTIDILKHSTGETLHLSLEPMVDFIILYMLNNEQLPIANIKFPKPLLWPRLSDTLVTYGILESTNIGYIYLSGHYPRETADVQFHRALDSLKNTDALIIDMRFNFGGNGFLNQGLDVLFNESHKTIIGAQRCNTNTFELCPVNDSNLFDINVKSRDYYDRTIAVLLGPTCMSMGDLTAHRLKYHPMVRFFGSSPSGSLGYSESLNIPNWDLFYSSRDQFHAYEPGNYLNRKEFPIDFPVWFNKEDVAKGIDPIVEKAKDWISTLAYGHSIVLDESALKPVKDTIKANATIVNPETHELLVKLIIESLDSTVMDSTQMKPLDSDDGKAWQGIYETENLPENFYWLSVKVENKTSGTYFTNKHMTRITTVPLSIDSLAVKKLADYKYSVQPFFKNEGDSVVIKQSISVILETNPWVKTISPTKAYSPTWEPGLVKKVTAFTLTCDTATFQNHFDLKFTIASQGWTFWELDNTISLYTGNDVIESLPLTFGLDQNFPNPFNSSTTIGWQLAHGDRVTLSVFDIVGRKVATLVDAYRSPGRYETTINAATLPKGIYFYQLKAGKSIQTRKMILLK